MVNSKLQLHALSPQQIYFILSGLVFALHTILLTLVPLLVESAHGGAGWVSLSVALYVAAGTVLELYVAKVAGTRGIGAVVVRGSILIASGVTIGLFVPLVPAIALASVVLSFGTTFMISPILANVAKSAGTGRGVAAQGLNALLQRVGGIFGAMFLTGVGRDNASALAAVGALLIAVLLGGSAALLPKTVPPARGVTTVISSRAHTDVDYWLLIAGMVQNGMVMIVLVYMSSLMPLIMMSYGIAAQFGVVLVMRETVAICIALLAARYPNLFGSALRWQLWSCLIAMAAITAHAYTDLSSLLMFLILALSGGALLTLGIVCSNVLIHAALSESKMYRGFAIASIVNKAIGALLPFVVLALFDKEGIVGGGGIVAPLLGILVVVMVLVWSRSSKVMALQSRG